MKPAYRISVFWAGFLLSSLLLFWGGCGFHRQRPAPAMETVVRTQGVPIAAQDRLEEDFAPVFLIEGAEKSHNRIGTVSARHGESGKEILYIDPKHPAVYAGTYAFDTPRSSYRNLVYRVHFPKIPFRLFPFHLTAGSNPGLLVVITLDSRNNPLLVTTVHTCGCYLAVVPTTHLPVDAYPEGWNPARGALHVYGETLPQVLDFSSVVHPRLMVRIRSDVHRVMGLSVVTDSEVSPERGFRVLSAARAPMSALEAVSIDGKTTSFFYQEGEMKGHVKGAQKLWESLLLSWISLDYFVGMDKAYADTGNPFYTSLKPWRRHASDMWRFSTFLEYYGWRL